MKKPIPPARIAIHVAISLRFGIYYQEIRLNNNDSRLEYMSKLGIIGRGFMFVVVGLVTIIVGSFLLRGNMHMWDKVDPDESKDKK
tara:strand:+ start:681 stop:938 length:258 start_codon:yes stop_codon:yes gene_type:complete